MDCKEKCTACGKPKSADRFRACPDCRADWRRYSRKPGGPAETIEALEAENERLREALRTLVKFPRSFDAELAARAALADVKGET